MRLRRLMALLLAMLVLASTTPITPATAAPPTGFTETTVLSGLDKPTAFAFLPDGSMLITTQPGRLLLYQNGALRSTPVLDWSSRICSDFERGMLGIAVDPQFSTNRTIFLYYTFRRTPGCERNNANQAFNRVVRLALSADLTGRVEDEQILIDNIPSPNGNHNAGDVQIGKDGLLYISTGDGGQAYAFTARERFNLSGKILRITRDGGIPPGNPFQGNGTARCNTGSVANGTTCQEIFALGLRNPYRIAFDPNTSGNTVRFFINDVGEGRMEEISEARGDQGGRDYGWHCFEGTEPNNPSQGASLCNGVTLDNTVRPLFTYRHRQGAFANCASITGGAFVPNGIWPDTYTGAYLFGDFVCGKIFVLQTDGSVREFDGSTGQVTHMGFGPDGSGQALYYTSFTGGTIRKVSFSGDANRAPTARLQADRTFGPAPLTVNFNAGASSDPDSGDRIATYLWDFGDGNTRETTGATTSYTFTSNGSFTVNVRVRDSRGATSTNAASVRVDVGNNPPVATIASPANGTRFSVGEQFVIRGSASDREDGQLAATRLKWEVRQHHDDHWHPYLSAEGVSEIRVTAPPPEDLDAVNNSYLEVILTATDGAGRASEPVTITLQPRVVTLRLETEPPGLQVGISDGVATTNLVGPATVRSWPGWAVTLNAPWGQRVNGVQVRLCGWSNGSGATQTFTTPNSDTTLRAIFKPVNQICVADTVRARVFVPLTRR